MFDLHLAKDRLNKVTGYSTSIKNAFYRNGIPDTTNAFGLMGAIANINPHKNLYIDSVDNCVRFYWNIEYKAKTFLQRLNELKDFLKFMNAPHLLIVEELEPGQGIDCMLMIKNQYTNKNDLRLAAYQSDCHAQSDITGFSPGDYSAFGSYDDALSKMRISRKLSDIELKRVSGSETIYLSKTTVDFSPSNDETFKASGMYFKAITFSEAIDGVSLEIIRYGDNSMDVRLLSQLEKL